MIHRKSAPQSATSIDESPEDDETARMKRYVIMMAVRTACVVLAFAVQPWGWQTFLFGIGAVFLPYIAVVLANQVRASVSTSAVDPRRGISASEPQHEADDAHDVIRVEETPGEEKRSTA
ncbi:MAG: DUF3099 domain-containing protein [Candidatus Microbacterium stercoravium]